MADLTDKAIKAAQPAVTSLPPTLRDALAALCTNGASITELKPCPYVSLAADRPEFMFKAMPYGADIVVREGEGYRAWKVAIHV